jgi:hypothetical protein
LDVPNVFTVMAFSPDGQLLAAGNAVKLRVFHLASGREVAAVECDLGIYSLAFSPDGKLLAAAGWANTALIYDVAALTADKLPKPTKPTAKELQALWDDLRGGDGAKAHRAVLLLAESGAESTPFLKERLKPGNSPDEKRIAQLIADLDDNSFEVREKASAALEKLGKNAETALTRALEKTESAEVRARARRLLEKLSDAAALPSEELVKLRVLEALENSGAPAARDVLKELTKGDADAPLTKEAKAALRRLESRDSP